MLVCTLRDKRALTLLPEPRDDAEMASFHYLAQHGDTLTPPGITLARSRSALWLSAESDDFRFGRRFVVTVNYALLWAIFQQRDVQAFDIYDFHGEPGIAIYDGARLWQLAPETVVYEAEQIKPASDLLGALAQAVAAKRYKIVDRHTVYAAPDSTSYRYRAYETMLLVDRMTRDDDGKLAFEPLYAALDLPLTPDVSRLLELPERTRSVEYA